MKTIIFFILFLFPFLSFGEFVKWVDDEGVTHYSDSYENVPEKYIHMNDAGKTGPDIRQLSEQPATLQSADAKPFVLQGQILDKNSRMLASLLDEGVKPSGKIDRIGRQVISVTAYADDAKISSVNPDDDLGFRFSSGKIITHVTVEVSGGGIYYRENGPWHQDAEIVIDLDKGLFTLDGLVNNKDGSPAKRILVSAYDETNSQIAYRYTGSQGQFSFLTNQPVYMLQSSADGLQIKKEGPWSMEASVILTVSEQDMFTIRGMVTDKDGNPVKDARVSANFEAGGGKSVMTKENGQYELPVDKKINHLYAYRELTQEEQKKDGPFETDETVNFVLTKGHVFTLEGQVTDRNGAPVTNVFVYASDDTGGRIKTTRTDRAGNYSLEIGKEAKTLTANVFPSEEKTVVNGPWQNDTTVNITLTNQ
ncbi:MAG: carboxypeptidase-like regulatory domain-containing protein [Proteobacteria bacterium]|nr:carboxypeptidase-like regulatory domain-containing protein [Pseudomonadota bacterium]